MAPPLTIRNLTAAPLELKLIERYEAPGAPVSAPKLGGGFPLGPLNGPLNSVVNNVTNIASNITQGGPSSPKLAENAKSFHHKDVNIRVDAFKTVKTDIKATERSENEILRLTIESDGQKYRIDTPSSSPSSQTFKPLTQNPRRQYTAVFNSKETFLTVYSSSNLNSWMRELKDETPLSALSIPGTHNSPTCHTALPSVRCQAVGIKEQLDNGIRFFDIRVQPQEPDKKDSDRLILVHGVFPISLTGNKYLRDLIKETEGFLDRNRSETVIISLKREGPGNHTDQQLSRILYDHYAKDENRWYTEARIPKLGEVRHKIVLMRRFAIEDRLKKMHGGKGWGINAENWAYNTPNDTHGDVCVQDFCEVLETENIDKKIKFSRDHLERAGNCLCPLPGSNELAKPSPFYLNFLSASNFWKVGCWPDKIAAKLNPAIVDWLCRNHHTDEKGDGSTGIVVCDWVGDKGDWDLVRCIVGMNSKLELREKNLK
ncbi:phosphatidylinositol phospholipase C [Patellaria atrata CBS 101060]|uniref:Phosphatidylinositol phospholipase C n=1 Tax=Patellaria atrata CBS 101060 TaxID=1346257 RepID=A0A9P4SHU2_9PEZI|nr:phosphatidylinositol phospholipase C [Patellaria atrata CBS 101060]